MFKHQRGRGFFQKNGGYAIYLNKDSNFHKSVAYYLSYSGCLYWQGESGQVERGQWAVYYNSPQSFTLTFSYPLA